MKLFTVDFVGVYTIGCCLVIKAKDIHEAIKIATNTITHTEDFKITEVNMKQSGIVVYLSGNY